MASSPRGSNLKDKDAEQLVTTEEGITEREDDSPPPPELDNDDPRSQQDEESEKAQSESPPEDQIRDDNSVGESDDSEKLEFLKEPPAQMTLEDFLEDENEPTEVEAPPVVVAPPKPAVIDIAQLGALSPADAAKIAEEVLIVLEEDLAEYVARTGTKFKEPLTQTEIKRLKMGLKEGDSSDSFNSDLSDLLPGEPSRVRMTYEKGVSVFPHLSIVHLAEDEMVDEEVQVNLHRPKKKKVPHFDGFSQTLEMTFIPADVALIIFTQIYPQYDEEISAQVAPSRQASQELAVKLAEEADPDVENQRKNPSILATSNRKQLLQPLMDNYYKDDKTCTGSRFTGEYLSSQFFKGKYRHPTGVILESEFLDGHFHTQKHLGCVSYPRGDTFEGRWEEGRYQTGKITFSDGLIFSNTNWKFLEPPDRRFKIEKFHGMRAAGRTLFSDQNPPPYVPPGMYDIGDGFYNPKNGEVRRYDGLLQKRATVTEAQWIEQNCRKVHSSLEHIAPTFLPERIPGSYCETKKRVPLTRKRFH